MAYIRISILRPHDHDRAEVLRLVEALNTHVQGQPGFIQGHVLRPDDDTGEIWRYSYWQSEKDADRAAQDTHNMALRSQIMQLLNNDDELHIERGFFED